MTRDDDEALLAGRFRVEGAPRLSAGREHGSIHLVTALPDGVPLLDRVAEPMSLTDALAVGCDLLDALAELHARGVLHRDVTPAAVTLCDGAPRAVLTAVGLAADAARLGSIAGMAADGVQHLAPETSGALWGGVDERSDLYSAGVLIWPAGTTIRTC